MRCSVCGTYIPEGQNNCGVCGYAVKGQTIRMIRLICADCGGVMDVDLNRPMEKCPYCNSKRSFCHYIFKYYPDTFCCTLKKRGECGARNEE